MDHVILWTLRFLPSTLSGVEEPLRELGRRIWDLRMERGWSQEKFADICGVHRTYMGHIERGEKNVSFNTLVRLAEALGITLPELLSDTAPGKKAPVKTTGKRRVTVSPDDLGGLVRELLQQRENLDHTAGALTDIANALRVHGRSLQKRT